MQFFDSASSGPAKAPERTSVPSTRIVCGLATMNGLPSSTSPTPSASFAFWIWAETAKVSKLSAIQASANSPAHFSARFHQGRSSDEPSGFGGFSPPSPPSPPRPSLPPRPERSGLRIRSSSRGRDL